MKRLLATLMILGVALACAAAEDAPRLLFTEKNIARLKNPEGREKVIALAGRKGVSGIVAWSLAYRVTGDRTYAGKVRAKLLKECVSSNTRPWSGLGGAHKCFETGVGFDSIRDFLTPEERRSIASGIVARGIEPMLGEWLLGKTRTTTLDSMGHNWWSACVFPIEPMERTAQAAAYANEVLLREGRLHHGSRVVYLSHIPFHQRGESLNTIRLETC